MKLKTTYKIIILLFFTFILLSTNKVYGYGITRKEESLQKITTDSELEFDDIYLLNEKKVWVKVDSSTLIKITNANEGDVITIGTPMFVGPLDAKGTSFDFCYSSNLR